MKKLRLYNIFGELEKEVTCLQVNCFGDYHASMDASNLSEYDKQITFNALNTKSRFVLFVSLGGLGSQEKPVGLPASLKVVYPNPKPRRAAV